MIGLAPSGQYSSVMAITDTEPKTERTEREDDEPQHTERRTEEEASPEEAESPETAESEGEPEEDEAEKAAKAEKAEKAEKRKRFKGIAGGAAVFLLLAIYFVWIGSEMGSAAISGTTEMWAIFGGIFLGVLALVGGGAISRHRNDSNE